MTCYFLARRLPVTHWYYVVPDVQNTAAIQTLMIAKLQQAQRGGAGGALALHRAE